jgi:hypothetical protein
MDYFEQGKAFAREFVWHKFKNSWATILGGLATVITPTAVALLDMPWIFHIFVLIPLSVVGSSFYWYKIAHADEYAKEGAILFQKYYKEQKLNSIKESLLELKLHSSIDKDLRVRLMQSYLSFGRAIERQEVISAKFRDTMLERADEAIRSGTKIFVDIKDLIVTLDGYDLNQLKEESENSTGSKRLLSDSKLKIYLDNQTLLESQREAIEELIDGFDLSKLNLAQATSRFDEQERSRENLNALTTAMNSAKRVQQKTIQNYDRYKTLEKL